MKPIHSLAALLVVGLAVLAVAPILSNRSRPGAAPPEAGATPQRAADERFWAGLEPLPAGAGEGGSESDPQSAAAPPPASARAGAPGESPATQPTAPPPAELGSNRDSAERLTPSGGCQGCCSELSAPEELVPAPPERTRQGRWLCRHQAEDGSWTPSKPWDDPCWSRAGHQPGDPRLGIGTTSLALLSFVGSGQTHRFGTSKRALARAVRWLKDQQAPSGQFGWGSTPEAHWDHALATLALCELYGASRDFTLKRPAERALTVCLEVVLERVARTQDPVLGGWLLLALKAAQVSGLEVPEKSFATLRVAFPVEGSEDHAVALLVHFFSGGRRDEAGVQEAAEALASQELRWEPGRLDLRSHYFATYALFQVGGPLWTQWHKQMLPVLGEHQRPQVHSGEGWRCGVGESETAEPEPEPPMDCREGSWDPVGAWGALHGRAGATALATMSLEVYYRYERAQKRD